MVRTNTLVVVIHELRFSNEPITMSYQRGSVRKMGRRWVLRRRIDGREKCMMLGTTAEITSQREARRVADERLTKMYSGPRNKGERATLKQFAPFFLEKVCAQKKPATRRAYTSAFTVHLLPRLGDTRLVEIGVRQATELVADLEASGKAPGTIRQVLMVLSHALTMARMNEFAAATLDLKALNLYRKRMIVEAPRIFTKAEVRAILNAASFPWRALYAILALTGMRGGEALGLSWASVDFERHHIQISQAAYDGQLQSTKTASSATTKVMDEALAQILRDYREFTKQATCAISQTESSCLTEPVGLLFPSRRDPLQPYWTDTVRKRHFAPLLAKLGIAPAGLHAFRHTYADGMFRLGKAANVVQSMMGHADIKSTLRYTRVTLEDQVSAAHDFAREVMR